MDWQEVVALGIVTITVLVFLVRWRCRRTKGSCGANCGCETTKREG